MKNQQHETQQQARATFLEKNIQKLTVWIIVVGTFLALVLPWIMSQYSFFGLNNANEVGDAFAGLSGPVLSIMGILLTFLAFYVQYTANERQVEELEKQKRNIEYKYIQEEISELKDEIRQLTYSKEAKTYHYSEAIWYFIHDRFEDLSKDTIDSTGPLFYQISYVLSLFEPLLDEIDRANLSDRDKTQALENLYGLFESSLELILIVYKRSPNELSLESPLKRKIIIPAKSVKFMLDERLNKYQRSEREIFIEFVANMKSTWFIKQARIIQGKVNILFYDSYQAYLASLKEGEVPQEEEKFKSFKTDFAVKKLLVTEPVRLMMKLPFVEQVQVRIEGKKRKYQLALSRKNVEDHCQLDLTELNIDKEMWRDHFLGQFVYDRKKLNGFIKQFCKVTELTEGKPQEQTEES